MLPCSTFCQSCLTSGRKMEKRCLGMFLSWQGSTGCSGSSVLLPAPDKASDRAPGGLFQHVNSPSAFLDTMIIHMIFPLRSFTPGTKTVPGVPSARCQARDKKLPSLDFSSTKTSWCFLVVWHSTLKYYPSGRHPAPCAEKDEINVMVIGASQLMGNYLPLLRRLLPAHKVVRKHRVQRFPN